MSYSIDYSVDAQKVIKKWKKSNPDAFKKLFKILWKKITLRRNTFDFIIHNNIPLFTIYGQVQKVI